MFCKLKTRTVKRKHWEKGMRERARREREKGESKKGGERKGREKREREKGERREGCYMPSDVYRICRYLCHFVYFFRE